MAPRWRTHWPRGMSRRPRRDREAARACARRGLRPTAGGGDLDMHRSHGGGRARRAASRCVRGGAGWVLLLFVLGAGSSHALDVRTAGVIVIGAGELGLLPLLVWGPLNPAWRHHRANRL